MGVFLASLVATADLQAQDSATAAKDPLAGRVRGSATAPVTVYEMSDFQCPYCRTFALTTFPALDSTYVATGKVRWVFINFPLTSVHQNAAAAALTAICAAEQNAFWPVHDLLYRHQEVWAPLNEPGGLLPDPCRLGQDLASSAARLRALAGNAGGRAGRRQGAQRAGAASTPTFYIEGGLLVGAQPLPIFRQVLDSILRSKAQAAKPRRMTS